MKKALGLASAVLLASSLASCGEGDSEVGGGAEYCDLLEETKADLQKFDQGDFNQETFDDVKQRVDELAEAAPDDVSGDWRTLGDGMQQLDDALADVGLSMDDVQGLTEGEIPEGVDMAELQGLSEKLGEITADDSEF